MDGRDTEREPRTRLVFARHGEVDAKFRGTVYGRLDVPLSERGLAQSARIGEVLGERRVDAVYSSGLRRADEAARRVAGAHGLEPRIDERLLELDRGDWAGRSLEDVKSDDPAGFAEWMDRRGAIRAPGGEGPQCVADRVVPACRDLAAEWPDRVVVIVAHLWVVRSAVAHAIGLPMERSGELLLPPGGLAEVDWPAIADGAPPVLMRFGTEAAG